MNINIRTLIQHLTLITVNIVFFDLNNLAQSLFDIYDELNLKPTKETTLGLLVLKSVKSAIQKILDEEQYLFTIEKPKPNKLKDLFKELNEHLTNTEIDLETLFKTPRNLSFLWDVQKAFEAWIEPSIKNQTETKNLSKRLPDYFIMSLVNEWDEHPEDYKKLMDEFQNPFFALKKQQEEWNIYLEKLQKKVLEPTFWEPFNLKQVYIPLRAYYEEKVSDFSEPYVAAIREPDLESHKVKRIVIDLEEKLESWLIQANPKDAIRLVAGSPGSGKSSFAKIFAAKQAKKGRKLLLVSLEHPFNIKGDLIASIKDYFGDFTQNLLEENNYNMLIIFDGLDELSQQGYMAKQVAKDFVDNVSRTVRMLNTIKKPEKCRLQVIILGRDLVIQDQEDFFGFKNKEVIHLLPYFLKESERNKHQYEDPQNLICQDQRKLWWKKYAQLKGKDDKNFSEALNREELIDITAQPLHNQLFATYSEHHKIDFTEHISLNHIYSDLLKTIYTRDSETHGLKMIEERYYIRILMEIAICAWHRNDLKITVKEIDEYLEKYSNTALKKTLQTFQEFCQENNKPSLTRRLIALYCRQNNGFRESEDTFEFTHNSFGLYLTAKRIVDGLVNITKKLTYSENEKNYDLSPYLTRDALSEWVKLCGFSAIDDYLFKLISGEIYKLEELYLSSQDKRFGAKHLQERICYFIESVLEQGMPMNDLNLKTFKEEMEKSTNAEVALLIILNCCAQVTKKKSEIQHYKREAFGEWIARLIGQRKGKYWENILVLNCLSYLKLDNCDLKLRDFYKANLEKTSFVGSALQYTYFIGANLEEADLSNANLKGARLWGANLKKANLEEANLPMASFSAASLIEAKLQGANLVGANLTGADLTRANLEGANLEDAILKGTILEGQDMDDQSSTT
ncbi:MAG: pentapeptide repeat-containing protein [Crocosphaera sp.]